MRLVATSGNQTLSFPLREGSTIIGRHSSCHICIPAKSISRRHCQCFVDGAAVTIRDIGSAHGTYVNGQRVERAELRDGDVVSLGGFQLRYEAGDAAAAAFPHAAAPADDVVTGGPTYGEPAAAAEATLEEPPPAPTDFPEAPDGDETPVDSAFVPQPYAGGQGAAIGAPLQPQLVVRDGRWFLRDPRTGREVEIAPKGAEAVPAVRPEAAEARRPNVRLLIAVVAGAAVVVVVFAALFLSQDGNQPKGPPPFPRADYYRIVDDAVDDVRAGDLDAALKKLGSVQRKRKDLQTARLLAQYVRLRKDAGEDLQKLNWNEARNYLQSIRELGSALDKTIAFVGEQLGWLKSEQTCLGWAEQAWASLKPGDPEERIQEVYNTLRQLPQKSYAWRAYQDKAGELRQRLARANLNRADRAMKAEKWADAVKHLQDALSHVDDTAVIKKKIGECQRNARDARLLSDARQAFQTGRYASAQGPLRRISPDGHYADDAKTLLAQIDSILADQARKALVEKTLKLYREGAGRQAVELAEKHKLEGLAYIKARVQRFEKALAAGQKAEKEKHYEEALTTYQEAVEIEPEAQNAYRQRADRFLQSLKARYPEIADEIADAGYRLIHTDPIKARKELSRALYFSPEHPKARAGLKQLQRTAGWAYNRAKLHMKDKRYAHARTELERAKACAEPGTPLYEAILKALEELPKE